MKTVSQLQAEFGLNRKPAKVYGLPILGVQTYIVVYHFVQLPKVVLWTYIDKDVRVWEDISSECTINIDEPNAYLAKKDKNEER